MTGLGGQYGEIFSLMVAVLAQPKGGTKLNIAMQLKAIIGLLYGHFDCYSDIAIVLH